MIEDKEIWACALHTMRVYGDAAALHSAQRADELLAQNDYDGCRTWIRILAKIEELGSLPPSSSSLQ